MLRGLKQTAAGGLIWALSLSARERSILDTVPSLEQMATSGDDVVTRAVGGIFDGGSKPVALSGSVRAMLSHHQLTLTPPWMMQDRNWTNAAGSGMELRFYVKPNRHVELFGGLHFNTALQGVAPGEDDGLAEKTTADGYVIEADRHGANSNSTADVLLHQDFKAGLRALLGPSELWLRAGGVLWTQASPLSIYTGKPRQFAWEYLPFEDEKSVAKYYADKILYGEDVGEAAMRWSKRPFQGLNLEAKGIPGSFDLNLIYGQFGNPDRLERDNISFDNIPERYLFHGRLAWRGAGAVGKDLTPALNYVGAAYNPDLMFSTAYTRSSPVTEVKEGSGLYEKTMETRRTFYYKEPYLLTADILAVPTEKLELHFDVAFSRVDTQHTLVVTNQSGVDTLASRAAARGGFTPAAYGRARSNYGLPVQLEAVWLPKKFHSLLSMASAHDAFMPFNSNMVGMAKMVEGSPYLSNMVGANLKIMPEVAGGKLHLGYGQHTQLEKGRDVIYFPHRLHGFDLQQMFATSWSRWGGRNIDAGYFKEYSLVYPRRLGDETLYPVEGGAWGMDAGGIRGDYLSVYESFVPYPNAAHADSNLYDTATATSPASRFVPEHAKWTFNLDVDATYDIGPRVGYPRPILLSGFASLNGISTTFKPLAFSEKGMQLWGAFVRFEPAIALTDGFYAILLGGFENWRAENAYIGLPKYGDDGELLTRYVVNSAGVSEQTMSYQVSVVEKRPIDYRDYAIGIGFDWKMLPRTGLHFRYKYMIHDDIHYSPNNWRAHQFFTELKFWF